EIILNVLECGRWAPSGVNYQPWHVFVVSDPSLKANVAKCSKYATVIEGAPHVFVIYLDKTIGYNYTKSVQSIGAFIENLLLGLHASGLGGVWNGEILNNYSCVDALLDIDTTKYELMAVIPFGYPAQKGKSIRKPLDSFVTWI
ncbi:MAG: nitroreductase family protein, partial [Promethearchaeota archaeon]